MGTTWGKFRRLKIANEHHSSPREKGLPLSKMSEVLRSVNREDLSYKQRLNELRKQLNKLNIAIPLRHLSGDAQLAAKILVDRREARIFKEKSGFFVIKAVKKPWSPFRR